MEYPTFATVYSRIDPGEPHDVLIWEVTVHEVGAQLVAGHGGLERVRGGVARRGRRHLGDDRAHERRRRPLGPRAVPSPGTGWLLGPLLRFGHPGGGDPSRRDDAALPVLHRSPGLAVQDRPGRRTEHLRARRGGPRGRCEREVGQRDLRPHHAHLRRALGLPSSIDRRLPRSSPPRSRARTCARWETRSSAAPPVWTTPWPTSAAPRSLRRGDSPTSMAGHRPSGHAAGRAREGPSAARSSSSDREISRCRSRSSSPSRTARSCVARSARARSGIASPPSDRSPVAGSTLAEVHPGARPAMDTQPVNDARSLEATPGRRSRWSDGCVYSAQLLAAAVGSLL